MIDNKINSKEQTKWDIIYFFILYVNNLHSETNNLDNCGLIIYSMLKERGITQCFVKWVVTNDKYPTIFYGHRYSTVRYDKYTGQYRTGHRKYFVLMQVI